jgi:protein gp37
MADNSAIEWTDTTWNPSTGCDRISAGCDNCYALTLAKRLKAMGSAKYQTDGNPVTSGPGFGLAIHPDTLTDPLHWRDPRKVFVNSMSDLFHAKVPREFVAQVFAVMAQTPRHTYQCLTKRPERMARMLGEECTCGVPHTLMEHRLGRSLPLDNCWLGTSIELDKHTDRADALRSTPAAVRFISAEPLLGPLPSLDLTGIDWLIIGGESGPGSRALDLGWVRELIAMARDAGTAVFVKQLGSIWARDSHVGGQAVSRTDSKGGKWENWPTDLRIREYPAERVAVSRA